MIETRPSRIHGKGLFAKHDIAEGTNMRPIPRNTMGFNHGCEPNVILRPRTILRGRRKMIDFDPIALRDIKADEELLVDYYKDDNPRPIHRGCRCPAHKFG